MARESKRVRGESDAVDRFIDRCTVALRIAYRAAWKASPGAAPDANHATAVREVMRMLAVLLASEQAPPNAPALVSVRHAAQAVRECASGEDRSSDLDYAFLAVTKSTGITLFAPAEGSQLPAESLSETSSAILRPPGDSTFDPLFFQTMPLWWLGCAYQAMLVLRPGGVPGELMQDHGVRKSGGVFFTPPCLVDYIVRSVLGPIAHDALARLDRLGLDALLETRILDPSMGGGDFLVKSIDFLVEQAAPASDAIRARIAATCVFGIDIDPLATDIARFSVWTASGYADGISDSLNAHLTCGNALTGVLPSPASDPLTLSLSKDLTPTFDAVIGNPPYVAAKNGLDHGSGAGRARGQQDSYLLFLSAAIERGLVREGGYLSMVLPDPMLVRGNAARIRCKLANDWTIVSLLHILGAFPGADVANVVPILRNLPPSNGEFRASRIERVGDRRSFVRRPVEFAAEVSHPVRREAVISQEGCEFFYLLEKGAFGELIRHIHGSDACVSHWQPPFAPLRELNVNSTYRGEEIGKSRITSDEGDLQMLLGGQSIAPYEIIWEGRRTDRSRVRKPLDRYLRTKLLVQKSSARVIVALDQLRGRHEGFVFPQSVYGIELHHDGIDPHYLLCVLNSQVINEYIYRTVTAYKMVQPQLELEDIRALPIRRVHFTTPHVHRHEAAVHGVELFENECLRASENTHFPELADFASQCLTGEPERSDVVHDILVHLGRSAVELTRKSRKAPDADITHRLQCTRAAIEALVWRLYCIDPTQMALAI